MCWGSEFVSSKYEFTKNIPYSNWQRIFDDPIVYKLSNVHCCSCTTIQPSFRLSISHLCYISVPNVYVVAKYLICAKIPLMTFGHCWLSPFPGWQIEAKFSKRRGPRKAIRICRSRPANFWCSAPQLPTHNGLGKGYQKYHLLIPGYLG